MHSTRLRQACKAACKVKYCQCHRKTCPGQYRTPKLQGMKGECLFAPKKKKIDCLPIQHFKLQTELQIKECKSASWPENDCNKAQRARNERRHTAIQSQRLQIACCLRPSVFPSLLSCHQPFFHLISCHSSTSRRFLKISLKGDEKTGMLSSRLLKSFKDVWHCLLQQRAKDSHLGSIDVVSWNTTAQLHEPNFGEHGFFIDEAVHTRQNSETQNKVFCRTLYYTKQV